MEKMPSNMVETWFCSAAADRKEKKITNEKGTQCVPKYLVKIGLDSHKLQEFKSTLFRDTWDFIMPLNEWPALTTLEVHMCTYIPAQKHPWNRQTLSIPVWLVQAHKKV